MAKPWTSKEFLFVDQFTNESTPAMLIRLSAVITKWEESPGRAEVTAPVKTVLSKTGKAIPASAGPGKSGPGKKKKK